LGNLGVLAHHFLHIFTFFMKEKADDLHKLCLTHQPLQYGHEVINYGRMCRSAMLFPKGQLPLISMIDLRILYSSTGHCQLLWILSLLYACETTITMLEMSLCLSSDEVEPHRTVFCLRKVSMIFFMGMFRMSKFRLIIDRGI